MAFVSLGLYSKHTQIGAVFDCGLNAINAPIYVICVAADLFVNCSQDVVFVL